MNRTFSELHAGFGFWEMLFRVCRGFLRVEARRVKIYGRSVESEGNVNRVLRRHQNFVHPLLFL